MQYWDRAKKERRKRELSSIEIQSKIRTFTYLKTNQDLRLRLTTLPFDKMVYNTIINVTGFNI